MLHFFFFFLIAKMTGAQNLMVATMILWMHKMVVVFWYLCMQSSFPTLNRIYEAYKVLPAFQASVPERQPDAKILWGQSLCDICTATRFGRTCNTNWKAFVAILWPMVMMILLVLVWNIYEMYATNHASADFVNFCRLWSGDVIFAHLVNKLSKLKVQR